MQYVLTEVRQTQPHMSTHTDSLHTHTERFLSHSWYGCSSGEEGGESGVRGRMRLKEGKKIKQKQRAGRLAAERKLILNLNK